MNSKESGIDFRVEQIVAAYGVAEDMPNPERWAKLGEIAPDQPVTLVNFFKLRERAAYPAGFVEDFTDISGQIAFDRYAAVSGQCLQRAGGRFLLVAPFGETFIGEGEDWDIVAVGTYPGPSAILDLFEDPEYRGAYVHRVAACAAQRVSLCIG